jgi:hypothetical protein
VEPDALDPVLSTVEAEVGGACLSVAVAAWPESTASLLAASVMCASSPLAHLLPHQDAIVLGGEEALVTRLGIRVFSLLSGSP